MKRLIIFAALMLFVASMAMANGAGLGIKNSPHDFTDNVGPADGDGDGNPDVLEVGAGGWNARVEICRVCHVPHDHGRAVADVGLLWNHALSSVTYTMYTSPTTDGTQDAQPGGASKMCLGCHDGTVGIDHFDKYTTDNVVIDDYSSGFQVPGDLAGTSLQGTHPISIVYDAAADGGLQPTGNTMGTSGTIASVLPDGKVECSSCHDVHDQESVANTHLLRVANKGDAATGDMTNASALCLTCHIK